MVGIFCRIFLAASLICSFWSAGYAAPEAGKAVAVVQSASATGNNGSRTLKAGMPVSIGERIKTGRSGQVQLVFTDDTKLVVGPNSSLVIEAYLLRSKSTVSKFAVTALGGSFRFISGKSPKQAYSIKTPTATIGVRGTSFDISVRRRGDTDVVLFTGEAEVCGNGGCVRLKDACSLANAPRIAAVDEVRSRDQRNRRLRERFPYVVSQAPLRRDFRVPTRSCGNIQKARLQTNPRITAPVKTQASIASPAPEPPAPEPPAPEPPEPPGEPGNPGNAGTQGNAGANPGGNDMGNPGKGRSDNNSNNGNNSGKGKGKGKG